MKEYGKKNFLNILMNKLILFLLFIICSLQVSVEEGQVNFDKEAYPFTSETKESLFYSLLNELRCPKCQSSNLAGSNSPISNDLKREVYELVVEGKSSKQIKDHLVDRYGNFIIYNPPIEPATYALWFGPFILILLSVLVIIFVRKRIT